MESRTERFFQFVARQAMAGAASTCAAAPSSSASPAGGTASLSAVISTLVPVLVVAGAMTLGFLILRGKAQRQYAPRTFMNTLRPWERTPALPPGFFAWINPFMKTPDTYVLQHQGIDGFLLLRYLKMGVVLTFVGAVITFIILFPVYATGGAGDVQLSLLTFSNIAALNSPRLYATNFVAWFFFGFIWWMITRETIFYINLRQAWLLSPLYSNRISSRTVLYCAVPEEYTNEDNVRRLFGNKIKNVWVATDCGDLQDLVDERSDVTLKLEGAETKLIKSANDNRLDKIKKANKANKNGDAQGSVLPTTQTSAPNGQVDHSTQGSGSLASQWVEQKDRPTHREKFLRGPKLDTINWSREKLAELNPKIAKLQADHRDGRTDKINSIFVEFWTQADAQAAYQATTHHLPLQMAPRFIGIAPHEVLWQNLRIKWWERVLRRGAATAFYVALIVFWALPVAFVGFISNINALIQISWLSWLSFLCSIPPVIFGVVQGLLPSVLLAVLMALLPIIIRLVARQSGAPSVGAVELMTQNVYFVFQVVEVFLVTTLGSSASAVGAAIGRDPSQAPNLLAQKIPLANNIYISYIIVQGLTIASGALLQIVGLILYKVLGRFLDNTPRKIFKRFTSLTSLGWGTVFPIYELLVVICIIYSCIAPLMLGFSCIGLTLLYLANRYNLLYVYDSAQIDCKGLVYPSALQHLTVGLYIAEVLMIGLFAVKEAPGPTVLMVIFLIASILYHVALNKALGPLLHTLPLTLETEAQTGRVADLEDGSRFSSNATTNEAGTNLKSPMLKSEAAKIDNSSAPAKSNFLTKFLYPHIHASYPVLAGLVPKDIPPPSYDDALARSAYYNPAITSGPMTIWIPRDEMGISKQEIAHTEASNPITDEAAILDEAGKVRWTGMANWTDLQDGEKELEPVPVYEKKVDY